MKRKWIDHYLKMCDLVASNSEDTSTQCGAVIVNEDNAVLSTGYNGFPRGVKNLAERNERPLKYSYFEHSERNAIYNAARIGVSTKGARMFITGYPCCDCARAIIQAGITSVVIPADPNRQKEFYERWKESIDVAQGMLKEAGVKFEAL